MKLPSHKCSLCIEHNKHRDYYLTAAAFIAEDNYNWKDEEAKARAITTDEIWTMQWYPDTPVGSYSVAAPTLDELLELANSYDDR